MHSDPGRPWQLKELAKSVAMSRTTFALRFKTVAGVPPLTYLSNWRMRIAQRSLREGKTSMSALALSLGYTSESAFSNAFKRTIGMAPKRYRDAARAGGPLQDDGISSKAPRVEFADAPFVHQLAGILSRPGLHNHPIALREAVGKKVASNIP